MKLFEVLFDLAKSILGFLRNLFTGMVNMGQMLQDFYSVVQNFFAYVPTFVTYGIAFGICISIVLFIIGRKFE